MYDVLTLFGWADVRRELRYFPHVTELAVLQYKLPIRRENRCSQSCEK